MSRSSACWRVLTQTLQEAQVDQEIDQGLLAGDSLTVLQMGMLDAEVEGLRIDAFTRGALTIDFLVPLTVPIEGVDEYSSPFRSPSRLPRSARLAHPISIRGVRLHNQYRLPRGLPAGAQSEPPP